MDTLPEPLYCEITVFEPVPLPPAEATFEIWHSRVHGESSKCQMGRKPPDNRVDLLFFFNTSLCDVWSWNAFLFSFLNIIAKLLFVEAHGSSDIRGGPWNLCGRNSVEMRSSRVSFINHQYLLPQLHISGTCVHFNTLNWSFQLIKKSCEGSNKIKIPRLECKSSYDHIRSTIYYC